MAVHLFARVELKSGALPKFMAAMKQIVPVAEAAGWKLLGAYVQRTGRINTIVDLWELRDHAHLDEGFAALAKDPRVHAVTDILSEVVVNETLTLADAIQY